MTTTIAPITCRPTCICGTCPTTSMPGPAPLGAPHEVPQEPAPNPPATGTDDGMQPAAAPIVTTPTPTTTLPTATLPTATLPTADPYAGMKVYTMHLRLADGTWIVVPYARQG